IPEIEELITKRVIGPLQGFRSKQGFPFAAIIRMTDQLEPKFDFGNDDKTNGDGAPENVDFTGQEPVGKCPHCGANVYESGMYYVCENKARRKGCKFSSGRSILQRTIEREQMQKLLATGKTDLLDKFISKRTGRPFKAYLVVKPGAEKVSWEFEAKAPRKNADARKEPAAKIDF